jgi:hypothetical protein
MAKTAKADLVPSELVSVTMDMDKDDVAAILMSRAEERIKTAIQECTKRDGALVKEGDKLDRAFDKLVDAFAESQHTKTANTLKKAANDIRCKDIEVAVTDKSYTRDRDKAAKSTISAELTVRGHKPEITWSVYSTFTAPAAINKASQGITTKRNEIADNKRDWMSWRQKLADLPSMERRAKAAVAEARLKSVKGGQSLIDMLDGSLDDGIKLLGIG